MQYDDQEYQEMKANHYAVNRVVYHQLPEADQRVMDYIHRKGWEWYKDGRYTPITEADFQSMMTTRKYYGPALATRADMRARGGDLPVLIMDAFEEVADDLMMPVATRHELDDLMCDFAGGRVQDD